MTTENKAQKPLRRYKKPTIERVKLVAEEATLRACTNRTQFGGENRPGCPVTGCQQPGSV